MSGWAQAPVATASAAPAAPVARREMPRAEDSSTRAAPPSRVHSIPSRTTRPPAATLALAAMVAAAAVVAAGRGTQRAFGGDGTGGAGGKGGVGGLAAGGGIANGTGGRSRASWHRLSLERGLRRSGGAGGGGGAGTGGNGGRPEITAVPAASAAVVSVAMWAPPALALGGGLANGSGGTVLFSLAKKFKSSAVTAIVGNYANDP